MKRFLLIWALLLGCLFSLPAQAQTPVFNWNGSDANATGSVLYVVADGGSSSHDYLWDYLNGSSLAPSPVPSNVTGSSTAGNPTKYDPTNDSDWPWGTGESNAIPQHIYAID